MAYGYNTEQPFFTTGAGNQPASVNNYMPENNIDLSSNQTWNVAPSHSESSADAMLSAENMPNDGDATVIANLPPMSNMPQLSQDMPTTADQVKHNFSMSGDKLSHTTIAEVSDAVGDFRHNNKNAATFYDEIRDAAESFRNNSFGARN